MGMSMANATRAVEVERADWEVESASIWRVFNWRVPPSELGIRLNPIGWQNRNYQYLAFPSGNYRSLLWMQHIFKTGQLVQRVAMEQSRFKRGFMHALGDTHCLHAYRLAMGFPISCLNRLNWRR